MVATNVEQFPTSCVSEEVDIPTGSIVEIDKGAARFVRRRQHMTSSRGVQVEPSTNKTLLTNPRACATQIDNSHSTELRSRVSLLTSAFKEQVVPYSIPYLLK
jgi:hypothetical protein